MQKGNFVKHKSLSVLAKVEGDDPDDKARVIIKPLAGADKPFSCKKESLELLR